MRVADRSSRSIQGLQLLESQPQPWLAMRLGATGTAIIAHTTPGPITAVAGIIEVVMVVAAITAAECALVWESRQAKRLNYASRT